MIVAVQSVYARWLLSTANSRRSTASGENCNQAVDRQTSTVFYSFSKNSQAEQEMKMPPGTPRSRSFTRLTIRVGLPHLGQSVLLVVSITFLRSAVFAIFAMLLLTSTVPRRGFSRLYGMKWMDAW